MLAVVGRYFIRYLSVGQFRTHARVPRYIKLAFISTEYRPLINNELRVQLIKPETSWDIQISGASNFSFVEANFTAYMSTSFCRKKSPNLGCVWYSIGRITLALKSDGSESNTIDNKIQSQKPLLCTVPPTFPIDCNLPNVPPIKHRQTQWWWREISLHDTKLALCNPYLCVSWLTSRRKL